MIGLQPFDQLEDLRLDRHIQRRCRLIADQQIRVAGDGHGDHDPLPHAAGQLVRILFHTLAGIGDADLVQKRHSALRRVLRRHLQMHDHAFHQLLADGHGRVERGHRILEDHGDPASVDILADPLLVFFKDIYFLLRALVILVAENHFAAVDLCVAGQNAHDRFHYNGFSGTGLSDDRHGLAALQVNIDAADRVHGTRRRRKGEIKIFYFENFICQICPPPYISSIRGANASRRPSPTKLNASIRKASTRIGGTI